MSIVKDIFVEEYDRLYAEAEESSKPINEHEIGRLADIAMRDRFAAMCDEAKERAKYRDNDF